MVNRSRRLRPVRPHRLVAGCFVAGVALAATGLKPPPAWAQSEETYINANGGFGGTTEEIGRVVGAQSFTTGDAANGYSLTSIGLQFATIGADNTINLMEVSLRADDSGNPASAKLAVLNNPNSYNPAVTGITNFTFSTPLPVDASTKYWVVADYSPGRDDAGGPNWAPIQSTPITLVSGWVFGPTKTGTPTGTTTWSSKTDAKFIIRVRGTRTLPEVSIEPKAGGESVAEGSAAVFTVSRTGVTTAALTVQLRVAEASDGDMVDSGQEGNKRVVIPIGSASAEYSVTTTGDMEDEPNSSVTVSVRSNSAYNIDSSGDQAAVTITDDDLPEVSIAPKAGGSTVTEGSPAVFTVSRAGVTTAALTVLLDVEEATGGDMVASGQEGNQQVEIPMGMASADYSVTTEGDSDDEPNSAVTVGIRTDSAYRIDSSNSEAAVTITDDDLGPLSVPAPENVSAFLEDGEADFLWPLPEATGGIEPYTYTLTGPNGEDVSVAVPGGDGLIFDPVSLVLIGAVTEEGTTTLTYTVTDSAPSPASVTHTFTITVAGPLSVPAPENLGNLLRKNGKADFLRHLPEATGGIAPYTYTLTGPNGEDVSVAVPGGDGLIFNPPSRLLIGAVTEEGTTTLTYTVTDSAPSPASVTHTFTITVTEPEPLSVSVPFDSRDYTVDTAIAPLTLPEATGGFPPHTYALTGPGDVDVSEAVPGLSFDPATRELSGTPTRAGTTTLTYTVTEADIARQQRDSVTHTFDVTVTESDDVPDPGPISIAEVDDRTYEAGAPIDSLILPEATGGTAPHTYALTGPNGTDLSEVPGLSFDPDTRVLSGTPTRAGTTTLTYTVTDSEGNATSTAFDVTVTESDDGTVTGPISIAEVDDRTYEAGEDASVTLPAATGGTPPYTYALTGPNGTDLSEVPGLTFDPATRVLSGTPTRPGTPTLTYTATDSEGNVTSTAFDVTVTGPMFDAAAVAEVEETVEEPYPAGAAISLTLPEASGVGVIYVLTGPNGTDLSEVPGLTFDPATRELSGTPTRAGTTTLTYTATDSQGNVTSTAFDVTVTGPVFDADAAEEVEGRTYEYAVDEPIADLRLPAAISDSGTVVTYALTGPNGVDVNVAVPGLSFDPATRELSGTPTRAGTTTLTYTATDSEATTSITFAVTVTSVIPAALNEVLLPEMVRAMAGSTVGAIARRIGQAARGAEASGLSVGGQDGWAALRAHGEAVSEGRRGFEALLSGSGFVLPLNAAAGGAAGASSVALWGSGEYRDLSGKSGTLDWDGELVGVHLGVDARPREDLLAGVAVSWLSSDLDYEDGTAAAGGGLGEGIHSVELTSVHPYLGWRAGEGLDVWATAGYGEGELEVTPAGRERRTSDLDMRTVGAGGSGVLLERGVSTVRLKGEVMHSTLEVDDSVHVEGVEVEAMRVRMTVEAGQTHTLADGGVLEPSLEVGVRHDGGDGETGNGAELGGSVSYRHPSGRITAEGRVYALVAGHDGEHEEWGIEGHLGVSPGAGGRGLSLSVRPGYGDSGEGGIGRLWRQEVSEVGDTRAVDDEARLETRLGYGLFLPGYTGVFTPYTGMTVGAAEGYRIGVSWKAGSRFDLDLVGERRESGAGPAEHALVLRGEVRF